MCCEQDQQADIDPREIEMVEAALELAGAQHFNFEDYFQGFSDLTRSTEAGTARLLVRAPSQQQQQNLKSLER